MKTIIVSSEEYGNEHFSYRTEQEREEGLERLKLAATELRDNIERQYSFTEG